MKNSPENIKNVLNLKVNSIDGSITIRVYLYLLLEALWTQKEGFSGKRPFGESSWAYDLYEVLIKNELISGKLDENGFVQELDKNEADEYVLSLIKFIFYGTQTEKLF